MIKKIFILLLIAIPSYSMENRRCTNERRLELEFLNAIRDGQLQPIEVAIQAGVNTQTLDVYNRNALHFCLQKNHNELLTELFEPLVDLLPVKQMLLQQDAISGNTPIHTFLQKLATRCPDKIWAQIYYNPVLKKIIDVAPAQVFITQNFLGKIPYDYLFDNKKINFVFPQLEAVLRPPIISAFNPAAPRLLSIPSLNTTEIKHIIKVMVDRKVVTAVLHALRTNYETLSARHDSYHPTKNGGKRLLQFLTIWDYMSKCLIAHNILQPELAHQIAWHQQFDPELSMQEKAALAALFANTKVVPNVIQKS